MAKTTMDSIDYAILNRLQQDGRVSNVELSDDANLSPPQCYRRLRRLQDENIISRYVALLNPSEVGIDVVAFVSIAIDRDQYRGLKEFEKTIAGFPEVLECYLLAGDHDYMLKVVARDLQTFSSFMTKKLMQVRGIIRTKTAVTLAEVKYTTALPIDSVR